MTEAYALLRTKLSEATKQYTDALDAEAQAKIEVLWAEEELRAAEGTAIMQRAEAKTLGTNDTIRRAQLDSDCSSERQTCLEKQMDLYRAQARTEGWKARYNAARAFISLKITEAERPTPGQE